MKAKDLIAFLEKYPPDMDVLIEGMDPWTGRFRGIDIVELHVHVSRPGVICRFSGSLEHRNESLALVVK